MLCLFQLNDGNPLRLWRSKVEISNVNPDEVFNRILKERKVWDDNLVHCHVIEQPDDRTQVVQTVAKEMNPHPSRDYCVMRCVMQASALFIGINKSWFSQNPTKLLLKQGCHPLSSRFWRRGALVVFVISLTV